MAGSTSPLEFRIPRPLRVVVGSCLLTAFLAVTVWVAIDNLAHSSALIASSLWLLLIGAMLVGFGKEFGFRPMLIEILGGFARRHFVRTNCPEDGQNEIHFGYQLLGFTGRYLALPVARIESVNWSTGQASHFAGRDMNDWSVALWYDHGDPVKSQKQKSCRKPDQEIYLVGPENNKEVTAAFGLRFIDYLRQSGAVLVAGDNDHTFVRPPAS